MNQAEIDVSKDQLATNGTVKGSNPPGMAVSLSPALREASNELSLRTESSTLMDVEGKTCTFTNAFTICVPNRIEHVVGFFYFTDTY